jgi:hypothetical protein
VVDREATTVSNRLIRLYPGAWRRRYESEFLSLLAERPPTLRDGLDIVRGALDAHLHPQSWGAGRPDVPFGHRIPGLTATLGGILWAGAYLHVGWTGADSALAGLIPLAFLLMFLSLPGVYAAAYRRQLTGSLGLVAAGFVLTYALPWGPNFVPLLVVLTVVGGGALALASARAGLGVAARWRLVAGAFVAPILAALSLGQAVGWDATGGLWLQALIVLPYGLAWIAVGALMAVRGAPTWTGLDDGRGGSSVSADDILTHGVRRDPGGELGAQ